MTMRCRTVFHIRNTRIFRRGHRVSPAKRPGPGRQAAAGYATPPIPPWPFPQVARRLFPGASGRSGASGFRAVAGFSPGFPTEFLVAKKSLLFLGAKKFGVDGFLPDAENACGNPFRVWRRLMDAAGFGHCLLDPSDRAPRSPGFRPPLPSSPHVLPGLSHGVSLRAPRGFPAGSPQAHAGFSTGILPPKADEAGPWDSPGRNLGVPTARPSR
jgi:hypothetical protein